MNHSLDPNDFKQIKKYIKDYIQTQINQQLPKNLEEKIDKTLLKLEQDINENIKQETYKAITDNLIKDKAELVEKISHNITHIYKEKILDYIQNTISSSYKPYGISLPPEESLKAPPPPLKELSDQSSFSFEKLEKIYIHSFLSYLGFMTLAVSFIGFILYTALAHFFYFRHLHIEIFLKIFFILLIACNWVCQKEALYFYRIGIFHSIRYGRIITRSISFSLKLFFTQIGLGLLFFVPYTSLAHIEVPHFFGLHHIHFYHGVHSFLSSYGFYLFQHILLIILSVYSIFSLVRLFVLKQIK